MNTAGRREARDLIVGVLMSGVMTVAGCDGKCVGTYTVLQEHLDLAEAERPREMEDWERELVDEARGILESDDWLELPSQSELHGWKIMDEFSRSVPTERERNAVADAIHGAGAFRNFKATVRRLGIESAWFAYKTRALETIARDWLTQNGFECLEAPRA
jgi:hypothetical protein